MAKPSATVLMAQRMAREIVANQTKARVMLGFDAAIIAAHNALGMGPGRAAAFAQAYHEAMEELAGMFIDDADLNRDKEISYSKGKRDELIRRIVGEKNFAPFDEAYGAAYFDELKRIRVMQDRSETRD